MKISDPPQGSGSGNPPYAMASLYGNDNDNVNEHDNNVPTVAAYAVSGTDLQKTTDTSFLPTSTPTIGTYSQGPIHQDVETAPHYNDDSSSPPTGSKLYPLPSPRSNSNTTQRWCLICGSLTLTIGLGVFICCILPIIIICTAVASVLRNSDIFPNNTQPIYHNYTNGTAGGYYTFNGTQGGF
jgi:hypothetical protein